MTRAVLVFHGRLRDADTYLASARAALSAAGPEAAGTLLVVPQFLAEPDIAAHGVPDAVLRWHRDDWMGGLAALGPAPIGSFEAIDAILARLADRTRFPHLDQIVVAGHSGGAQLVQRYAVLGHGESAASGVRVRYVVANPSSYAYFSADRPTAAGGFAPFDAAQCRGFDQWKYGMAGAPSSIAPAALERSYAARNVIYLLGGADTDPNHPALDKSCAAEAQGPTRLTRGQAYFRYLTAREGTALTHHLYLIPGVGHDGYRMLTSACGLAALFDQPGCSG